MTPTHGQIIDVTEIQKLIPHRPPFLLVDRVISWTANERLTALKAVTMNEPHFVGHFPAQPVMPGVLILEALAQAAALLAVLSMDADARGRSAVFLMGVDGARFRRPVVPGDRLELKVEVVKRKGPVWVQGCQALVDGQLAAEAQFMAKIADH